MRQVLLQADLFWSRLPSVHKFLTLLLTLFVGAVLLFVDVPGPKVIELPPLATTPETTYQAPAGKQTYELNLQTPEDYLYTIEEGDTLSAIFDMLRIPQSTMYEILETDLAVLALDTLRPGNHLRFWVDSQSGVLMQLEMEFSVAHKVTYQRIDGGGFEYKELILPGTWEQEVLAGEVNGSFYLSAQKAGLNASEIMDISALLKEKLNFNKGFRAGDSFQIVRSKQLVKGQETGNTKLEGIRILNQKREITAFLYKDTYYDHTGLGMERAFSRYPLAKQFRISSPFNPKRRHPVTRLIRPHNGTDFATPIGTPVHSTGDGVVVEVKKHAYAGLYIKIKHGQKYQTRYLHLKKALVSKGQTVSRGQKIALSGNSGRSTGPHLHYELHINNRPVNAMSADIPIMTEIEGKDRQQFKAMVNDYLKKMG